MSNQEASQDKSTVQGQKQALMLGHWHSGIKSIMCTQKIENRVSIGNETGDTQFEINEGPKIA